MRYLPLRFIGQEIEVEYDRTPALRKTPGCPDRFVWEGQTFPINALISEWSDFQRRGRMARNMSSEHAARASRVGSWGVGRFYFRVEVAGGRVFDLYYDRAPKNAADREGSWFLDREMAPGDD